MLCPHQRTVSIINRLQHMRTTRQDRASSSMSSTKAWHGDRQESGTLRHIPYVRTALLRTESYLPRWYTTSRNSETALSLLLNNRTFDRPVIHAITRSTLRRAARMMTSPSLTSSSALYDCVPGRDRVTVNVVVMHGGRGGSNLYNVNASEPVVGKQTTNVRVFSHRGHRNG